MCGGGGGRGVAGMGCVQSLLDHTSPPPLHAETCSAPPPTLRTCRTPKQLLETHRQAVPADTEPPMGMNMRLNPRIMLRRNLACLAREGSTVSPAGETGRGGAVGHEIHPHDVIPGGVKGSMTCEGGGVLEGQHV